MPGYSLTHVADSKLAQALRAGVADDRAALAMRLAQIAEFDHRRLYLPAYPSMYQYCLGELKYSEDAACKRIHVARAARRFPVLFASIADGRHSLSTLSMLVPSLLPETVGELVAASAGLSKDGMAHFLAHRFPKSDVTTLIQPIPDIAVQSPPSPVMSESPVVIQSTEATGSTELSAPGRISPIDPAPTTQRVVPVSAHTRVVPRSPDRYAIQVTVSKATHDKLRQAQALLSHAVPSGDVAEVLDRALDALIVQLEKRKYGATDRPGRSRGSKRLRHVPVHVKRAVRVRDGDQCTHVDDHGKRCTERKFLELDHITPIARGGGNSVSNLRLRCRAHNQYEAERVFGAGFMRHKRERREDASGTAPSADRSSQPPGP